MAPDKEEVVDLDKVTPISEWFKRIGLPARSGFRLIKDSKGPVITRLTERRYGVRESDHRAWLDSRRTA